jgi:endonuclease III
MELEEVQEQLSEVLERLGPAARSPLPLGNKEDPYDELIYILLTVMTRSQPRIDLAFERLQAATEGDWSQLARLPRSQLDEILAPLGFMRRRGDQLVALVRQVEVDHGGSLDFLEELSDADALTYLTSLPGVGLKTAKCVLMYSLMRPVLPTDVHVLRVAKRLGLVDMDMSWAQVDRYLEATMPPEFKYDVHVRFVQHGRDVCKSRGALCEDCVLLDVCPSGPLPLDLRAHYV